MEYLYQLDWHGLFVPKMSVLEIVLRGILVYVGICLLLRVVLRRQAGKVALSDLLVVTLIAGVCRNPLVADAYSIPDGLGVAMIVLASSYAVDWLSFYSPAVHALMHPEPVLLIRDGIILQQSLVHELMTERQLRCKLRGHGINDPAKVAEAWMEGEGHVSVIKKDSEGFHSAANQADRLAHSPDDVKRLLSIIGQLEAQLEALKFGLGQTGSSHNHSSR
jgi:uncharacterized membrane protein YcaP (DUF421 family)